MTEPPADDYLDHLPGEPLDDCDTGEPSELGGYADGAPPSSEPGPFSAASREELVELVGSLRRRLHQEAELLAETALSEHLTPELYRALRGHTTAGVLDALGLSAAPAPHPGEHSPPEKTTPPPETYFRSVDDFVDQWLFTVYRREVTDTSERRWCRHWRRHSEAAARIDAMWRVFETLRTDPALGASVLWKDHLDVHMEHLMSPTGPFEHCSVRDGHTDRLGPLPSEPAPPTAPDSAAAAAVRTVPTEGHP